MPLPCLSWWKGRREKLPVFKLDGLLMSYVFFRDGAQDFMGMGNTGIPEMLGESV